MNERGFIHILLIGAVVIFFIIAIITAIVIGLDRVNQQQGGKSFFNKNAKIVTIMDNLEQKKEDILNNQPAAPHGSAGRPAAEENKGQRLGKHDEELDELRQRIRSE